MSNLKNLEKWGTHRSAKDNREGRQVVVADWVVRAWGKECLTSIPERVRRVLEEAAELFQAEDMTEEEAIKLIKYVFARPKGEPTQEAAGIAVTLLGYAQSKGFSLHDVETAEIERVLAKDVESLRVKHAVKAAAGVGIETKL